MRPLDLNPSEDPLWLQVRQRRYNPTSLLASFNINHPPVPVDEMAIGLGIKLYARKNKSIEEFEGAARFAHFREQEPGIVINPNHHEYQQRWIVSVGMWNILYKPDQSIDEQRLSLVPSSYSYDDKRAEKFSSDLLLPYWMVTRYVAYFTKACPAELFNVMSKLFQTPKDKVIANLQELYPT